MTDILNVIQRRQSVRLPFDRSRPVDKDRLRRIIEAARWAPTPHNMQNFEVIVVDDKELLRRLGKIKTQVSGEFLRENYQQLAFSEEELRHKKVGILGTTFPTSWVDPEKFEVAVSKSATSPLGYRIDGSPTLLIVTYDPTKRAPASEGDFLGVMGLGCVMENMWLAAQSLGIGVQVLSVFRGGSVEKEVKWALGIPRRMRIAYALRLGYPLHPQGRRLRVRRDAAMLAHHNRYGATDLDF